MISANDKEETFMTGQERIITMLTLAAGFAIVLLILIGGQWYYNKDRDTEANEYAQKASAGYIVYLDGVQIDGTKIDYTWYLKSANDDKKEIYLTKNPR